MVKFLKKPMSATVFKVFCCLLFAGYFCFKVIMPYDTDLPFLVATGRDIISNGLSDKNVFIIDSDIHFVIQQWLYTVVLAVADSFGWVGMSSFLLVQIFLIFFLGWQIVKRHNVSIGGYCLCFFFMSLVDPYFFNLRPQNVTMIFILLECLALDRYRDSGKWQWLMILPVSMIFEMNFHMSMWVVHYAVLIAYMVPAFYCKRIISNDILKKIKTIGIFAAIMTGCLFLNPYGLDGIMFGIDSMSSGMQAYLTVAEHTPAYILSSAGATIIVLVFIGALLLWFKGLKSVTAHLVLGFSLMTAMYFRNCMFLLIAVLYLVCDMGDIFKERNIKLDYRKDLANYLYFILVPMVLAVLVMLLAAVENVVLCDYTYNMMFQRNAMYAISDYLEDNADKSDHIYAGYVLGHDLEYVGYNNIYMDARPESYTLKLNRTKDILRDYSRYGLYGVDKASKYVIDKDELEAWIDEYDFEYFIIDVSGIGESSFIRGYLTGQTDKYELVDYSEYMLKNDFKVSDMDIALYKKK